MIRPSPAITFFTRLDRLQMADGHPRTALLVASTGGHLEQLKRLEPRFAPAFDQAAYATFDDPQSRSLLAGRDVHFVPYIRCCGAGGC